VDFYLAIVATALKVIKCYREVPREDRFMKIYINHPQTTKKWRLEIPSHLGGVGR